MKKAVLLMAFCFLFVSATHLLAKCQYGSGWEKNGKRIIVCVKGDSFSDRKKARAICEKVKGSSCGNATTFSSSCGNGQCYDENGNNHWSLSGY